MYNLTRNLASLPRKYPFTLTVKTSFRLNVRGNHTLTTKTTPSGPLVGVKILDLTRVLAVSYSLKDSN